MFLSVCNYVSICIHVCIVCMYVHYVHILLILLYVIHSVKHLPIHNNNTIHISYTLPIDPNCRQKLSAGANGWQNRSIYALSLHKSDWLALPSLPLYLSIHAWLSIFMALPLLHTIMSLSMPLKLTQNHGFYIQEIASPKDLQMRTILQI